MARADREQALICKNTQQVFSWSWSSAVCNEDHLIFGSSHWCPLGMSVMPFPLTVAGLRCNSCGRDDIAVEQCQCLGLLCMRRGAQGQDCMPSLGHGQFASLA